MKEIADANPAAFSPHPFAILGIFIPEVRLMHLETIAEDITE